MKTWFSLALAAVIAGALAAVPAALSGVATGAPDDRAAVPAPSDGLAAQQPTMPDATSPDMVASDRRERGQAPTAASPTIPDPPPVAPDEAVGTDDDGGNDDAPAEVPPTLAPGDEGEAVASLQQRLHDLGYWLGAVDGTYGERTRQAVLAFQGVEGLGRDGVAGPQVHGALDGAQRPAPPIDAGLALDLDRQTLMVVSDGRVRWTLHTSTGSGRRYTHPDGGTRVAATPSGDYRIGRRVDGWRDAPLGRLYRPAYFNGGIAIHGYANVPAHPASHGCARVSIEAMDLLWHEGHVGDGARVLVH